MRRTEGVGPLRRRTCLPGDDGELRLVLSRQTGGSGRIYDRGGTTKRVLGSSFVGRE